MQTRICRLHGQGDIRIENGAVRDPGPGEVLLAVGAGGICGSDLHYFQHGGIGTIRVREPIILGHEAAGTVVEIGADVMGVCKGDRVAINPSQPCGKCRYCLEGLQQHCLDMQFMGSAMRLPHEQGLFRDHIVVPATQSVPAGPGVSLAEAACAEPLAVCLHARRMAGPLKGKRVLITGAGPIGVLCAAVAAEAGAAEIVVTDLQDMPLATASAMGATRIVNISHDAAGMDRYARDKGYFDVVFECSAAAPAIRTAFDLVRPQGTLVQVGVSGDTQLPINLLVAKEIAYRGTFRFHAEFAQAVEMISAGSLKLAPMISMTFPMENAMDAFAVAGDRSQAVKVQLSFL